MQAQLSDVLRPNGRSGLAYLESATKTLPGRIFVAIAATALIAAGAHISVRLPFTPVPLTMSDFAVLLVGLAFGPVPAFSVLVLYLGEGAAGVPVFNPEGLGGITQLMGPTGGYLYAYPLAAFIAGMASSLRRAGMSYFTSAVIASTGATAIIFAFGAAWLAHVHYLSTSAVWSVAVAPFLFGAAIKIVAAAILFASSRQWISS